MTTQQDHRIRLSLAWLSPSSQTPSLEACGGDSGGSVALFRLCSDGSRLALSTPPTLQQGGIFKTTSLLHRNGRSGWRWGEHQTSAGRLLLSSLIWVLKMKAGLLSAATQTPTLAPSPGAAPPPGQSAGRWQNRAGPVGFTFRL